MAQLHSPPAFCGDPPAAAQDCDLIDRRELALVAVERTRMPMIVTDPRQADDPIILANQSFLDLTGYASEEVIGRNCRFLQGPDTRPSDVEKLRTALARGNDNIEIELLNYRKDGTTFVNALDIRAVRSEHGDLLYYLGSQKDVTAQRKAQELEASERRLLLEVDHRALNVLALVQSIVNLSRASDVKGLSRAIQRRVSSLGRVHRLLAERRWQSVSLTELINAQLSPKLKHRVTLDGVRAALSADVVQPLGLVIHELMSNAQTHGGLSQMEGHVNLAWSTDKAALVLNWSEATHSTSTRDHLEEGFGLQIVRTVIEEQLRGTPKIEVRDGNFHATIIVPNAVALAP